MTISKRHFWGAAVVFAAFVAVGGVMGCGGAGGAGSGSSGSAVITRADVVDVTYYYLPG